MLNDERPIRLDELAMAIKRLYKAMDKLDSKLISYERDKRESVFVMSSVLYNRKAISYAYDLTSHYVKYELEKEIKLVLYNKPIEQILESLGTFEKVVEEFCMKDDLDDHSDSLYMDLYFLPLLGANLSHIVSLSLSQCIRYECDLIQCLVPKERIKEVNRRMKEIERNSYFFSKEHAIVLYEYRTRKLQNLEYIKEDAEEKLGIKNTQRAVVSENPSKMKDLEIEVLKEISLSGEVIIHKDLPKESLSTLRVLAGKGFIEKLGFKYKILQKGYEELERLQSEMTSTKSVEKNEPIKQELEWNRIKELIANNKWNDAIDNIKSSIDNNSEEFDLIVSIEAQITTYKMSSIKGIMSFEEDSRSKNKITSALLEMIKLLEFRNNKKRPTIE